ncbi:hypothetical protein ZOSMA_217G00070 [Zostera marina]|uniref:Uncharacterized protein n=1 Tax=Zostera marina TaxID=29655 RepID=A0A0K9PM65_ZOSMR|nr:hypothetical protein ZOSMA_217G00070 [Zostera marina]
MSFKLYDWNPADFPRRLRRQIFQWLDKEGMMYNNTLFQILQDGTSLVNVKMEVQVPKLHYVYPVLFEAGKSIEIFACGSNLFQPNFW